MNNHTRQYDGILLFSGGLDSILAARLLQNQGLRILCLHFTTPFFGNAAKIGDWQRDYGLTIAPVDIAEKFVAMLGAQPEHGLGKTLNPCIDCKILLLATALEYMRGLGASFIATGEVIGQRPMSQRREALDIIAKQSGAGPYLLRPLSARVLKATRMEESGLVDRSRLGAISGRGRLGQLALAREMLIEPIPGPGGGCLLTERENARKYWPLLRYCYEGNTVDPRILADDFAITALGRILFKMSGESARMLCVGRNENDNARIRAAAGADDLLLRLSFPGPLGLARGGADWDEGEIREVAAVFANFSPRAREAAEEIRVQAGERHFWIKPSSSPQWLLPEWPAVQEEIRSYRRIWSACAQGGSKRLSAP